MNLKYVYANSSKFTGNISGKLTCYFYPKCPHGKKSWVVNTSFFKYGMQKKVMKLNSHLMQTFNDRTFSIYFIADYHDSG